MSDRTRHGLAGIADARRALRRSVRPRIEGLENRDLMAILAPIADISAPTGLGYQVPLDGGVEGPQTYTVTSDNPAIGATVAQGKFLTVGVSHDSSGANDPAFTGSLTFQLFDDLTPLTTGQIEQLVNQGFYTSPTTATSPILPSKNFHRVAGGFPGTSDFIVQGGSQTGTGSGSLTAPGFPFVDEFNPQLAFTGAGQLAMANAGDDTNDSQVFITTGSPRFLDFQHTIFGQQVAGQDTLALMTQVAKGTDGTTPVSPILFTSTTLSDTNPDGVIHLDLTGAAAGQSANVTVTGTDAAGATITRTFAVGVAANVDSTGAAIVERPFLSNSIQNQVVGQNQTAVFQLPGVATTAGDSLTYGVGGGITTDATNPTFSTIANGTASVDANGVVTVVPTQGFTGTINLLVGVRDQTLRTGTGTTLANIGNYDTQKITLTVTNGQFVNLQPIASPVTATVGTGQANTVQLAGNTANPDSPGQTLQYTIVSQPSNGTLTNLDAATGQVTYLPNTGFFGTDTFTYRVTDVGDPTPNLASNVATVTLIVGGADTRSVRVIDRVLVVTPPAAASQADKKKNTVEVHQSGTVLQVFVNGLLDANQPNAADIDRIVVYGTRNSDTIRVGPEVLIPTTLDGGHGGVNILRAGGGTSTMFGWFRTKNVLKGSPANDRLTGRQGFVKFVRSGGNDQLFAGEPRPGHRNRSLIFPGKQFGAKPRPPGGTFYKFIGENLVAVRRV